MLLRQSSVAGAADFTSRNPEPVKVRRTFGAWLADVSFVLIETTGWLLIHTLAVLGCAVAAFLVLSGADMQSFFLHLDNMTSRYADADFGRRAAFEHQVLQIFLVAYVGTLLIRAPRFLRRLKKDLRSESGKVA